MNTMVLLPHRYKKIGAAVFIPATIVGIVIMKLNYQFSWLDCSWFVFYNQEIFVKSTYFSVMEVNLTYTLFAVLVIGSGLLMAFSKEKTEDEYIANLRLSSLQWAVLINYLLLIICYLFIFGFVFLDVILFNVFTVLVIFNARFNYLLYKERKKRNDEE